MFDVFGFVVVFIIVNSYGVFGIDQSRFFFMVIIGVGFVVIIVVVVDVGG